MQFEIDILPKSRTSPAFSRNTGLKKGLAVLARLPGKRLAIMDDSQRYKSTSMALYLGYSVPIRAEEEIVPPEEINEIVVKAWSGKQSLPSFILERDLIAELGWTKGVPQLISQGEIGMRIHDPVNGLIGRDAPYFIMPMVQGQDLLDFQLPVWADLPKRGELARLVTEVLPELAERLAAIHEGGVVHRDVKPNNIMFDPASGNITLLDFGRANRLGAPPREDFGEFGFYPPEIILNKPEAEDVRYDTYGLGATGFMMISGMPWLLFEGIKDPGNNWWLNPLVSPHNVQLKYYQGISERGSCSIADLVARSNLPPALKETEFSKFLISLLHPRMEKRPFNMRQVAGEFRRLGGQLLEHELYSPA